MRPVIGIISTAALVNDSYPAQMVGLHNAQAVSEICGAQVLFIPADPAFGTTAEVMARCDGFVFPGARANVHPSEYGHEETPAHGDFDRGRDGVALPLIRACVDAGKPILGICRGFQEVAVAFGATLHPEIRDLPGRDNHRMPPDGTLEEKFAMRHEVSLAPGGRFAQVFGAERIMTNSLHGQGILTPGPRVVIEGYADDGTAEALYVRDAPGFTLCVQWHPEWRAGEDPASRALFAAFGDAVRAWVKRPA